MKMSKAFPGKYLRASDLEGRTVDIIIARVHIEDVSGDQSESKPVIYFQGKEKGIVLNKTNANTISELYGDETDYWTGKPITIYPTETPFQGRMVPCIRVKIHAPEMAGIDIIAKQQDAPPADDGGPHRPVGEEDIPF